MEFFSGPSQSSIWVEFQGLKSFMRQVAIIEAHGCSLEVLDFVKYVWCLNIFHKELKKIRCFFCKCSLMHYFILELFPQM